MHRYYRSYAFRLSDDIKRAKRNFHLNEFNNCQDETKKQCQLIDKIIGEKKSQIEIKKIIHGNTEFCEMNSLANLFNEYFSNVANN